MTYRCATCYTARTTQALRDKHQANWLGGYCGTRKTDGVAIALHEIACKKNNLCQCGGYHFPHRKAHGACHHAPDAIMRAAKSAPASLADVAFDTPGRPGQCCPF